MEKRRRQRSHPPARELHHFSVMTGRLPLPRRLPSLFVLSFGAAAAAPNQRPRRPPSSPFVVVGGGCVFC